MAAESDFNYILLTNRQVSAESEKEICLEFESIPGVANCLILGETWIEDTLDSEPRLLRLVPRLYGIGDLSQILSFAVEQQTAAILEDLASSLRTYVPTESYRQAEKALHEHRFVVLVGPPASGKSTIAANLCVVYAAQDPDVRVLRVESADQFKSTWSPADPKTIYWVDDVFGETTLDAERLREWSMALDKIEVARQRGARVIFCTRDYILASAESRLKRPKIEVLHDARVRVDVASLTDDERAAILYNHIKMGDLPQAVKARLKPHLDAVAKLQALTPEIARRLGSSRFHTKLDYSREGLFGFVFYPVEHFADLVHGLSDEETAALAMCVLYGNAVPAPIPNDSISQIVCDNFGITRSGVAAAMERLNGSLVRQVRKGTQLTWHLHHPSMFEALQDQFSKAQSRLELYVNGAKPNALLRNSSTISAPGLERLVFIPETLYPPLIARLQSFTRSGANENVAEYLVDRASDQLLWQIQSEDPDLIDRALSATCGSDGSDPAARLGVRLYELSPVQLLDQRRKELLQLSLLDEVNATGWSGWLEIPGLEVALPGLGQLFLKQETETDWQSLKALVKYWEEGATSSLEMASIRDALDAHASRVRMLFSHDGGAPNWEQTRFESQIREHTSHLDDRVEELEKEEAERAIYEEDMYRDRMAAERHESEFGRFSDVDE